MRHSPGQAFAKSGIVTTPTLLSPINFACSLTPTTRGGPLSPFAGRSGVVTEGGCSGSKVVTGRTFVLSRPPRRRCLPRTKALNACDLDKTGQPSGAHGFRTGPSFRTGQLTMAQRGLILTVVVIATQLHYQYGSFPVAAHWRGSNIIILQHGCTQYYTPEFTPGAERCAEAARCDQAGSKTRAACTGLPGAGTSSRAADE